MRFRVASTSQMMVMLPKVYDVKNHMKSLVHDAEATRFTTDICRAANSLCLFTHSTHPNSPTVDGVDERHLPPPPLILAWNSLLLILYSLTKGLTYSSEGKIKSAF